MGNRSPSSILRRSTVASSSPRSRVSWADPLSQHVDADGAVLGSSDGASWARFLGLGGGAADFAESPSRSSRCPSSILRRATFARAATRYPRGPGAVPLSSPILIADNTPGNLAACAAVPGDFGGVAVDFSPHFNLAAGDAVPGVTGGVAVDLCPRHLNLPAVDAVPGGAGGVAVGFCPRHFNLPAGDAIPGDTSGVAGDFCPRPFSLSPHSPAWHPAFALLTPM